MDALLTARGSLLLSKEKAHHITSRRPSHETGFSLLTGIFLLRCCCGGGPRPLHRSFASTGRGLLLPQRWPKKNQRKKTSMYVMRPRRRDIAAASEAGVIRSRVNVYRGEEERARPRCILAADVAAKIPLASDAAIVSSRVSMPRRREKEREGEINTAGLQYNNHYRPVFPDVVRSPLRHR
ncbi:hypothetical protein BJ875DRAFT_96378 [Amylocarpus encephaloides]|uniref:Uncharacterized protein n=1 Tax=Amylocarpus encephaloides TaxID=45428 RepID=A0A9P8C336_9HELO|nr:hypothetical protein BJ875DRAFT_96378 [Amylocarpus encephaloides]